MPADNAIADGLADLLMGIVSELGQVPGVEAVVLGGSRARGTHTLESDVDLGLYCGPNMCAS